MLRVQDIKEAGYYWVKKKNGDWFILEVIEWIVDGKFRTNEGGILKSYVGFIKIPENPYDVAGMAIDGELV